jgi:hypothetical protein
MDQLMESTRSDKLEVRRSAVTLLCAFCRHTHADYSQYVPQLLRGLIHLFTDSNPDVLQMAWEALSAVTKVQKMEDSPYTELVESTLPHPPFFLRSFLVYFPKMKVGL